MLSGIRYRSLVCRDEGDAHEKRLATCVASLFGKGVSPSWLKDQPSGWMLDACLPLGPWTTSNETFWPSFRVLKPWV